MNRPAQPTEAQVGEVGGMLARAFIDDLGAAIIEPARAIAGRAAADRDALPCFPETFTDAAVASYQRGGYRSALTTTIAGRVPPHAMARPAEGVR